MSEFKVCVGVDGSRSSAPALALAIREAVAHGGAVHAVTAWSVELIAAERYGGYLTSEEQTQAQEAAKSQQDGAIEAALAETGAGPNIERHIVQGLPGPSLVAQSAGCQFLIVGTEHKGVLKRALLGSTSAYCIRNARIPVIVVPDVSGQPSPES